MVQIYNKTFSTNSENQMNIEKYWCNRQLLSHLTLLDFQHH